MTIHATYFSWVSRSRLFRCAWLMLVVSLLFPMLAGPDAQSWVLSSVFVVRKALAWSAALPGDGDRLTLVQSTVTCLALFANILFLYAAYLPQSVRASRGWKALSTGALVVGVAVGLLVQEMAHLIAYWLWLLALVLTVIGFVGFGEDLTASSTADADSVIDRGEAPPLVMMLLGFTLIWIVVNAAERAILTPTAISATQALKGYVNDSAQVLNRDEASRLDFALQGLEKKTTTQIAVAIYPRVPNGSIEEFTMRAAERLPLGRPDMDNGALLFIFVAERAARLEVGYGLEGTLPDVWVKRMLETTLSPALARGDYFGGIDATLNALFAQIGTHAMAPDALANWASRLRTGQPNLTERWLRAVSGTGFGHRVLYTIVGAFAMFAVWAPLSRRRASAKRRRAQNGPDGGDVFESLQTLWAFATFIPVGIVIIVAGGGMFGGAGALIHW